MAQSTFACHMSKAEHAATCAGFLLRGADHNLSIRLAQIHGRYHPEDVRETVPLYEDYRAMAIANGVDPEDESLRNCR